MTLMMITLMKRTHCLEILMVLPDAELIYMSPQLRRGGRIGIEQ